MDKINQPISPPNSITIKIDYTINRFYHDFNQKFRNALSADSTIKVQIELKNTTPDNLKKLVAIITYQVYINLPKQKSIELLIDDETVYLQDAIKRYLPSHMDITPNTIGQYPILVISLDNGWPVTNAIRWFLGYSDVNGLICTSPIGTFDPKNEPNFVLFSLGNFRDIVTPYTRQGLGIAGMPEKFYPDGVYKKREELPFEVQRDYPYPLCQEVHAPFVKNSTLYVPINTAIGTNGVFLLALNAETNFAFLPKIVYNGANDSGCLVVPTHFLPFRFIIEKRRQGFKSLCEFVNILPFESHFAICLLILCLCAVFDLCQANNIVVLRFLGGAVQFKTSVGLSLIRLILGETPHWDFTITPKLPKERLIAYVDERESRKPQEDRAEKLLFNSSDLLRLILTSGRMAPGDANMITKSVDFDCTDASLYYNASHTDENTRIEIDRLRPAILSFFLMQVPALFDLKKTTGLCRTVEHIRETYNGNIKVRLAETLAPVLIILHEIEDLMIESWGPEHDAESVFEAFMKYEERIGQILEQAKNSIIENIEQLGQHLLTAGTNSFDKGVKFNKTKRLIKGTFQMWFDELSSKYPPGFCPFANKKDLETQLWEASKHLEKTGWHFNWKYNPHNRPGVVITLPIDFEKDMLPDEEEDTHVAE